jgi:predicted MPP superfamily phosphohydrolase
MIRGIARGIRKGDLFPAASRVPVRDAPGGTTVTAFGAFQLVTHRVPVRGLAAPVSLVQLTDVHLRQPTPSLTRLAGAISALSADVVVLTGDIVAREWQHTAVHYFLARLPEARLGRFACMGNWEHWAGFSPQRWREMLAPHRVRLLVDEAADVGPIRLVGLDDGTAATPQIDAALSGGAPGVPTVVLSHSPGIFPAIARPSVALVLSGHTHGGQVRVPGVGALWVPMGSGPYILGFYEQDRTLIAVGRGLGWSLAPLRANCPPEVVRFELYPEESA